MTEQYKKYKNAAAVFLCGEIDHCTAQSLKDKIDIFAESANKKNLIIDLSNVQMMDSSGIALIIGRMKNLAATGGSLAISGAKGGVRRVIELSGTERLVGIYETADEAAKSFK